MRGTPSSAVSTFGPLPRRWAGDVRLEVLGTAFRVRWNDPAVGPAAERLLAPFLSPTADDAAPDRTYSLLSGGARSLDRWVYRHARPLLRTDSWDRVLGALLANLNIAALDAFDGLACHAGVVAADGRAVAFPASSGGGKSTLVAACLRAGFEYVSDEALCFRLPAGEVLPYPKPLRLSRWARRRVGLPDLPAPNGGDETLATPEDLGSRPAAPPLELAHVVLADRSGRLDLRPHPRSEAVSAILRYAFNHHHRPTESFRVAVAVAERAGAWRLRYRDPLEAARLLRELLA